MPKSFGYLTDEIRPSSPVCVIANNVSSMLKHIIQIARSLIISTAPRFDQNTHFRSPAGNDAIRKVSLLPADAGAVTTLAGAAGAPGYADGPGVSARFSGPMAVAVSPDGAFALIADAGNAAVRHISLAGPSSGVVMTLSGAPDSLGTADGERVAAQFLYPNGLGMSLDGRYAVVTDRNASTVRMVDTATGYVTTVAGLAGASGTADGAAAAARFYLPGEVTVSPDGKTALVADEVGLVAVAYPIQLLICDTLARMIVLD